MQKAERSLGFYFSRIQLHTFLKHKTLLNLLKLLINLHKRTNRRTLNLQRDLAVIFVGFFSFPSDAV